MFYTYGISEQGTYHKKINLVCQDAHKIIHVGDDIVVAAVADGLGSEKYTDIASKLAVSIAVDYCADKIGSDMECKEILNIIQDSFSCAQDKIERTAQENGHDSNEYDTTLSLAVVVWDTLYYGHSGDSGIIAFTADGKYEEVTSQQRDENGCVFPLVFKDRWIFNKYGKAVQSVLLATDGMLEAFFPIYIHEEKVHIYVKLAEFFMDPEVLQIAQQGEANIQTEMGKFIESIPGEQINDDKTIVVAINPEIQVVRQPDDYYAEPDWDTLIKKYKERLNRILYPDLYNNEKE